MREEVAEIARVAGDSIIPLADIIPAHHSCTSTGVHPVAL
jgi:hypothetical protein